MMPAPCKTMRLLSLLGVGGVLLQTGSCVPDTIISSIESYVLSYIFDTARIIFMNLLNV
jgi:hypothetical protein